MTTRESWKDLSEKDITKLLMSKGLSKQSAAELVSWRHKSFGAARISSILSSRMYQ